MKMMNYLQTLVSGEDKFTIFCSIIVTRNKKRIMACDLYCPNCGENLGKDTQQSAIENCGTCGEKNIFNEFGDKDELTDEELSLFNKKLRKRRGY